MCGLYGIFYKDKHLFEKKYLEKIVKSLKHRGPDDYGCVLINKNQVEKISLFDRDYVGTGCLMHTRLSIVDPSSASHQPFSDEKNHVQLLFNGEIYNFRELRRKLKVKGYVFRTTGDTEVISKAYLEWGLQMFEELDGMFSIVLYDSLKNELVLARDPFGIKPLYYHINERNFIFSSEQRILAESFLAKKVNLSTCYKYLRFGVTDMLEETLFDDIKQVPSASYIRINLNDFKILEKRIYWSLDILERKDSFFESSVNVKNFLIDSVDKHTRSSQAIGIALSGGIDSSILACIAKKVLGREINAFSFVTEDPKLNEEFFVNSVICDLKIPVTKVTVDPNNMWEDLLNLIYIQGEPFASTSVYAQYLVYEAAKKCGIRIMLGGQGADEIFAGYTPYFGYRCASLIESRKWKKFLVSFKNFNSNGLNRINLISHMIDELLREQKIKGVLRTLTNHHYIPPWLRRDVYSDMLGEEKDLLMESQRLKSRMLKDMFYWKIPHLLRYEDRNAMCFSIENRVPFLTKNLASYVYSLPENYLISENMLSKRILRFAMQGIVPENVLERRDKIGFATPEQDWLLIHRKKIEKILKSDLSAYIPFFNTKNMLLDWNKFLSGKSKFNWRFWRWVNFIEWVDLFKIEFP